MSNKILDIYATVVVRHPVAVLISLGVVAVVLAAGVHRLRADLAPERLVAGEGDHAEVRAIMERELASETHTALILVRASNVLSRDALQHVHDLSRRAGALPGVARVDGPTVTPIPHPASPPVETLEDLAGGTALPDLARQERLQDAVGRLVASDPARFPAGMHSLGDRQPPELGPVVVGERVTERERTALAAAWASSDMLRGRLLSADRRLAAILVTLREDASPDAVVRRLRDVVDQVPAPAGASAVLTGLAPLRTAVADGILDDQLRLVPLGILVNLILLALCFRWLPGVVLPMAAAGAGTGAVVGSLAWLDIPLDLSTNVVPALLITLGIADAIHVVSRYREERAAGLAPARATLRSTRRMVVACFLTSLTTAVGFGSLVVAHTDTLRRLGWVAALGVMGVFVVVMTMLPAMLALLPRSADRGGPAGPGMLDHLVGRLVGAAVERPVVFTLGTVALVSVAAPLALRVPMDGALLDPFDRDAPVRVGAAWAEEHLDGVRRLEVVLRADGDGRLAEPDALASMERIARWAEQWPLVLGTTGPSDHLRDAWRHVTGRRLGPDETFANRAQVTALSHILREGGGPGLSQHLSADGRHARVTVSLADVGIVQTERFLDALDEHLAQTIAPLGGVDALVGGEVAASTRGMRSLVRDLTAGFGLAAVAIFGAVALLFRSLRLSLLAAVPNLLPLVLTLAWMGLRDIPLGPGTAIVFTVALGLAVDGTIHVLARFREELGRTADPVLAVRRAGERSGRAVVVASLTLIAGFLVLLSSAFVPVRQLGELAAVSLVACLLADLVLLPSMLAWAAPALRTTWASGKERPCPNPGPSGESSSGPPATSQKGAWKPPASMPS